MRAAAIRAWLLVLLAGYCLVACGTEPSPPPPPFAEKIIFQSDRASSDGAQVLYAMNPDGSNVQPLTVPHPPAYGQADISPDGKRVAFSRDGIYTIEANGANLQHPLLNNGVEPVWSPDGTHLAYSSNAAGSYDVWTMDRFGNQQINLTNSPDYGEFTADWSSDGRIVVYSRYPLDASTRAQLWTISADGSNLKLLLATPGNDLVEAAWSRDGNWIAYVSGPGYFTNLRAVRPDGSGDHSILSTDDGTAVDNPAWSPDGQSLVFSYGLNIATIHADGTGLQVLTDSAQNFDTDWGPAPPP